MLLIMSLVTLLLYLFHRKFPDGPGRSQYYKYGYLFFSALTFYSFVIYSIFFDLSLPVFLLFFCIGVVAIPIIIYIYRARL